MNCRSCFCVDGMKSKMELRKDKKKFLRIIQKSNLDPLSQYQRQNIISQMHRSKDVKILEINDFTPVESVGSGASSDVCLLVRKDDGKKFAGKFLKGEIGTKDFINEATILKSCSNTCATIVNMVGIITTPKCLVLDFHVNGSLDEALREDDVKVKQGKVTEFPFLRRLGYILDVCKAVNQLHRENICHRDIAMRNLLLSDNKEHVVLTDFSLSRIVSSAIKRQSTLTALVPTKSAPETFRRASSSICGSQNFGRYYSLKSDIWSLGITMFEIINKEELGDITEIDHLPSRFPTGRLPSAKVFNRIQDLWILILRCWNERPEERPQSWYVQERMEMLTADPLYNGNENDTYTRALCNGITAGSIFEDGSSASCYSQLQLPVDGSWMSTVYEDVSRTSSGSIKLESSTSSCVLAEQEPESSMPLMEKDFFQKISSYIRRRDIGKVRLTRTGRSKNKQKQLKLNEIDNELFSKNILPPPETPNRKKNTLSQHFSPKYLLSAKFPLQRNKSVPSTSNTRLLVGQGFKFLKKLESVSSMLSFSLSARFEDSFTTEKVKYCAPLSVSFNSTATNIRYCKDRSFFNQEVTNLTAEEKPSTPSFLYVPDTPNTDIADGQPANFELSDTPHFNVAV